MAENKKSGNEIVESVLRDVAAGNGHIPLPRRSGWLRLSRYTRSKGLRIHLNF